MSVDQRDRIERLKKLICDVAGEEVPILDSDANCPLDIEEAFLERVLWYERALRQPLRDRLAEKKIVLVNPDELNGRDLSIRMWDAVHALITLQIIPVNTDHLSDREVYTHLWKVAASGEPGVIPDFYSRGWYIDFTGHGEDGFELYLKYYACEDERLEFSRAFPERPMPEHCDLPHNRDHLIPDL